MTQYIVTIPDNQISFFTELMNKLNIALNPTATTDLVVPEWHKEIALSRLDDMKKNPTQFEDWNTMMKKLDEDN